MSVAADNPVKVSYGRCCVHPAFFDRFYNIFLESHPKIKPMFANTDMTKQKSLLRQGLSMLLMHVEGNRFGTQGMEKIAESHSRRGKVKVDPGMYDYWIDSLLKAIKECDPQCTPLLEQEWKTTLKAGTKFLASKY
ncbi:MAG: globin [Nitrospira defluvii]|nr:globin [Nitrospira defluvii]